MLSVEIMDKLLKQEKEAKREQERPVLQIPLDTLPPMEEEKASEASTLIVLDMSDNSLDEFQILSW